jgi:type IV pilus assembly protein PilC
MPYRYLAYSPQGEQLEGVLDVDREEAAERILFERNLTIVDLQAVRKRIDLSQWFPSVFGPKRRDIILFSRQLATLTDAGVALMSALRLLGEHVTNKPFGESIKEIEEDVRMGSSLSDAMEKHPFVFDTIFCRMVDVGQRTGNFGVVLRQLATYMEKAQATASKIRGAMTYPIGILMLAVVVAIIIINVTLPPLMGLFEEFGADLPWTTKLLLFLVNAFTSYNIHMFVGASLIAIFLAWYVSTDEGRRRRDAFFLKLPILGRVIIQGTVSRISRTMATLLQAGLPLPEVIDLTRQTIGNVVISDALENVRQETLQGRSVSEPFSRIPYFPSMVSFMLRIGEETGTMDSHLDTLADFYEDETDRSIKTMTSTLEPAMTVFVGLVVGFVAVSVIMPMYQLLGAIK